MQEKKLEWRRKAAGGVGLGRDDNDGSSNKSNAMNNSNSNICDKINSKNNDNNFDNDNNNGSKGNNTNNDTNKKNQTDKINAKDSRGHFEELSLSSFSYDYLGDNVDFSIHEEIPKNKLKISKIEHDDQNKIHNEINENNKNRKTEKNDILNTHIDQVNIPVHVGIMRLFNDGSGYHEMWAELSYDGGQKGNGEKNEKKEEGKSGENEEVNKAVLRLYLINNSSGSSKKSVSSQDKSNKENEDENNDIKNGVNTRDKDNEFVKMLLVGTYDLYRTNVRQILSNNSTNKSIENSEDNNMNNNDDNDDYNNDVGIFEAQFNSNDDNNKNNNDKNSNYNDINKWVRFWCPTHEECHDWMQAIQVAANKNQIQRI